MKKILALCLMLLLSLSLIGCGQQQQQTGDSPSEIETIGDAQRISSGENEQEALYGDYYIYAFESDGTCYRAIAAVPAEISDELWDLDWDDPKKSELVAPLPVEKLENLSEMIPSQEELDSLVGKTAQELFDDGWYNTGWNLTDMEFWMNYGPFSYTVVLDGDVGNYEDFEEDDMAPLVVKSISCDGLGDATSIELDEDGKLVE